MAIVGRPRSATSRNAPARDFDELLSNSNVQRTVERRSVNQDAEESAEAARVRRAGVAKGVFTANSQDVRRDGRPMANGLRKQRRELLVKRVLAVIERRGWQSKNNSWVARAIIRLTKTRHSERAIRGYVADARKLARPG